MFPTGRSRKWNSVGFFLEKIYAHEIIIIIVIRLPWAAKYKYQQMNRIYSRHSLIIINT